MRLEAYSSRITIKPMVNTTDAKRDTIRRKNKISSSSPRIVANPVMDKIVVIKNMIRVPTSTRLNTSFTKLAS